MTYVLTSACPENAIVQGLPSGNYDLTHYGSVQAAVDAEDQNTDCGDGEKSYEELVKEIEASISEYTREEVLEAAEAGYGWPLDLGFVADTDDPKFLHELEEYLMPKVEAQISRFKKSFDTATLEDIESEFFGENDQLEAMLKDKGFEAGDVPLEYLRSFQHDAISHLRDHFETE